MTQWTGVLSNVVPVELVALALVASWQWARHRARGAGWAALSFCLLAAVGLTGRLLRMAGWMPPPGWLLKALIAALLLVPFFLYRFAAGFDRARRGVRWTATVLTAGAVLATAAIPYVPMPGEAHPAWFVAYRMGVSLQWAFLCSFVAFRLWRAGAHQPRAARYRMRLLAAGATGLDVRVILGALGLSARPTVAVAAQLVTIVAAGLFSLGMVLPARVRSLWHRSEGDALQTAMADLVKASSVDEVASTLLPHVAGFIGASRVALVDGDGRTVASYGGDEDAGDDGRASEELRFGRGHHLVVWTSPYVPFFGRKELRTLRAIGDLLDLAVDRCNLAERERVARDALVHQAAHDSLTGLPNRALFLTRLSRAVCGVDSRTSQLAVMFVDLDRFKLINDGIDHAAGDALLVEVARRLRGVLRTGDTVARFGGDEFVILTEVDDRDDALAVADRVCEVVASPMLIGGRDLSVTASVGVVVTATYADPSELMRDADTAMYRAKDAGRNRVELFSEQIRTRAVERLDLERRLHHAVDAGELRLDYQPTVRLDDGRVAGVEALVRWQHPSRGLLAPAEFIAIAEESDLIASLGTWVLDEACRQMAEWRRTIDGMDGVVMWVNMSPRQFHGIEPAATVARVLARHGVPASAIGVEITESMFMANTDRLGDPIRDLKDLGVSIAIDDFGTGFSSLGYLKRFPVDVIKIDSSFVQGIGGDPEDSLVTACLALAQSLGLETVAEGVETPEQVAWLARAGCTRAQGHHYSAAVGPDEAALLLARSTAAAPVARLRAVVAGA